MSYRPPSGTWVVLRDPDLLEDAMRARDVDGTELAKLTSTTSSMISGLRTGERWRVRDGLARRLEHHLGVADGQLFRHDDPEAEAGSSTP